MSYACKYMAFLKLPRLFGRKDLQFHVERHTAVTSPAPGEDRLQPQDSGLVVWGIKVKHDDGTITSRTHMMGAGIGTTSNPLDDAKRELSLERSQHTALAERFDSLTDQGAVIERMAQHNLDIEAAHAAELARKDQQILAAVTEIATAAAPQPEPPVEDDYEYTDDIETMSDRQLMGMSFD